MKAIACTKYGPPDVLQLKEVEKPTPKEDEVRIKIYATTVSSGDVIDRTGTVSPWAWLPTRIKFGFRKPKRTIPGAELVGENESVGKDVILFRKGDQVFGNTGWCPPPFAEYVYVSEDFAELKPANLTFEQAAAVPETAFAALHGLRDKGQIQPGQKLLKFIDYSYTRSLKIIHIYKFL
ncbi:zinc-binding alcohol dehydrogenase family protein [Chloroflexota bacterium]